MSEEKKKRTLPAALAQFKFQKGHKRGAKPVPPQADKTSPKTAVTTANAGAVTTRRVGLFEWLGL